MHVCPACSDFSFGSEGDSQVVELSSFDCTKLKLELERFSVLWITFVLEFVMDESNLVAAEWIGMCHNHPPLSDYSSRSL